MINRQRPRELGHDDCGVLHCERPGKNWNDPKEDSTDDEKEEPFVESWGLQTSNMKEAYPWSGKKRGMKIMESKLRM